MADAANSTLRKVVVATGAVLTVAGSAGFTGGADGTGTAARFYSLSGLALDGTGNLYVADLLNNTIRKVVVASAAVTTLAGLASGYGTIDGTGATARFYGPAGVANDGAGNLYIADVADYTIRKVVVATAAVTTLAGTAGRPSGTDGTGAGAGFNGPTGVTLDGAGNLYVADSSNNTIRKVVVATGDVTTLAGMAGLSGSTDATGSAARFNNPSGVVLDAAGNLNGDYGSAYIRWLTTTCRSWNHEHSICSAERHAPRTRSAA